MNEYEEIKMLRRRYVFLRSVLRQFEYGSDGLGRPLNGGLVYKTTKAELETTRKRLFELEGA